MGTVTLSDIRDRVRIRLGVSASDQKLDDATLDVFINAALTSSDNMRDWWWNEASRSFDTVADTQTYAQATDARKTIVLSYNDLVLPYRAKRDLIKHQDRTGEPRFWTIEAGQLKLYPTPDGVYTINEIYQTATTELTAGADTTPWPDYAIDLVVLSSAMSAAAKVRQEMLQVLPGEITRIFEALKDETRPAVESSMPARRDDWRP